MGIEQRELLAAVDHIAGVVDVEGDAVGRGRVTGDPLVDERIG